MNPKAVIISCIIISIFILAGCVDPYKQDEINAEIVSTVKTSPDTSKGCSRLSGGSDCPEGYFCYESISGGLGPDGPIDGGHIGGGNECYKLCETDSDCPDTSPHCVGKEVITQDMAEIKNLCLKESCAGQGEKYYKLNYKPDRCCKGLTDVFGRATGYISIADQCYSTGEEAFLLIGKCSDCGNRICESVETVCGCPEDCRGQNLSDYATVQDFCTLYWDTNEAIRKKCRPWESFSDNSICELCT